jgi:Zn-dependent protease
MDFFNAGIPLGSFRGIAVRLHFTFLIFAFWRIQQYADIVYGIAVIAGLYVCILLHEFGHAFAARWCDGECDLILLWPLGGLAFARPAFHPTAHLITTLAGPFVTMVLWLTFAGLVACIHHLSALQGIVPWTVYRFLNEMRFLNLWLLLFNMLLPAFPMDGGRMVRDVIWHWTSAEKATRIAVRLSQTIAIIAAVWAVIELTNVLQLPPVPIGPVGALILAAFILMQASHEEAIVGYEAMASYEFSLRERWRRGGRRRAFQRGIAARRAIEDTTALHSCASCGRTEDDAPDLEFRVCPDCTRGQEYCLEHLEQHQHQ